MQPGPLILAPKEPRKLQTAHEILAWVITQDLLGELAQDPVSVPAGTVPWIAATFQRRQKRALN